MLVVCTAASGPAAGASSNSSSPTPAEAMVDKINAVRSNHGLRPLRQAPRLMRSSRRYARHMVRANVFAHGTAYRVRGFRTTGEILAMSSRRTYAPMPTIRQWLRSSSHRGLVLSRSFRWVGAGPMRGRMWGRRTTVWVVHFGAR